jgi:hypothetical protein
MKRRLALLRCFILLVLLLGSMLVPAAAALGQEIEDEPNNTCATAQTIPAGESPQVMEGELSATPTDADVDFFHFTGTPNALVQVELEGQGTGQGSLVDPYLGLFDAGCGLIASDDDGGTKLNSTLQVFVPADGVFIMAVTICCDSTFEGKLGAGGSYRLSVTAAPPSASVGGRVIDSATGSPVFASVELRRCFEGSCFETVAFISTDGEGRFLFNSDNIGGPLTPGSYQVAVTAFQYRANQTEPFDLLEGEAHDVGDIALEPVVPIAGIGGRAVDADTGAPLRGDVAPFAIARLYNCDDFGSCYLVNSQPTDAEGRFRFESDALGTPLPAGSYGVQIEAQNYQPAATNLFFVAEGEDRDLGDIRVTALPVQFSEIRPCGSLPPEGGMCQYSFRVTNLLSTTLDGAAWSLVEGLGTGSLTGATLFQPRPAQAVSLSPRSSTVVWLDFNVPENVADGTSICAYAFFGRDKRDPYFNTVGFRSLFCIVKGFTGNFSVVPERQAIPLFRQQSTAPAALHITTRSRTAR